MFNSSAQARSWIFKNTAELKKRQEIANRRFIINRATGMSDDEITKHFLTASEERMVCGFYERILLSFCKRFQPPLPKTVIGCAFQYFKRFYLDNSVMDYHPRDIIITCMYVATKVEEFNVSIDTFVDNMKGDQKKAMEIILSYELLLMQKLHFDLATYHPFRPVEGFLIHIKTKFLQLHKPERLRKGIKEFLEKIQFSDACLLYSPSQIALAAISYAAKEFIGNTDGYLLQFLCDAKPKILDYVKAAIKSMFIMIEDEGQLTNGTTRKSLDTKLERCRNQENNPESIIFKRKMEELKFDDDDEMEPPLKHSRLYR